MVAMDPVKLAGIIGWQILASVKGVRLFLGFGNFYRKFIEHYSEKAAPLQTIQSLWSAFYGEPIFTESRKKRGSRSRPIYISHGEADACRTGGPIVPYILSD